MVRKRAMRSTSRSEHHEVGQQPPLVGLGHAQQHRGEQATQDGKDRGGLALRKTATAAPASVTAEHAGEGGAAPEQAIERVGGEEREIQNAEPAAREPFRE